MKIFKTISHTILILILTFNFFLAKPRLVFAVDNTHSLLLNGTNQYVKNESTDLNLTNGWTWEAAFYLSSFGGINARRSIMGTQITSYTDSYLVDLRILGSTVDVDGTEQALNVNIYNGADDFFDTSFIPNLNTWYRVALVKIADNDWKLYVLDGVSTSLFTYSVDKPVNMTNNLGVSMGVRLVPSEVLTLFHGFLDEGRVWDDVRTQAEIEANAFCQLTGSEANLKAYWKLNNDYEDSTSGNYDLTAVNSPTFSSTNTPFANNCSAGGAAGSPVEDLFID